MKKILIFDRLDSKQFPGGDTIQINAIANYLRENGHEVIITSNLLTDLQDCDIVFIFNLTNPIEAYLQALIVEKMGKPYILFPVYWNLDALKIPAWSVKVALKNLLPHFMKSTLRALNFWRKNKGLLNELDIGWLHLINSKKLIRFTLLHSKYVCPNSKAELEHIIEHFQIKGIVDKCRIIYNGVDLKEIQSTIVDNKLNVEVPEKYICCIGGIGPRKNQLNLVKAMDGLPIDLLIVGKASAGCGRYLAQINKCAGPNIHFLNSLPHQDVLKIIYRSHSLIQPSYIETPGLAALEAVALGIPVIVSDLPPVKEYFKELAFYSDPHDIDSIRHAILRLFDDKAARNDSLHYFQENYGWRNVLKEIDTLL
jgi:glycosyltransferase involved in cell wall biosynthesis